MATNPKEYGNYGVHPLVSDQQGRQLAKVYIMSVLTPEQAERVVEQYNQMRHRKELPVTINKLIGAFDIWFNGMKPTYVFMKELIS